MEENQKAQTTKIISPKEWGIYGFEKNSEIAEKLKKAIDKENIDDISKILSDGIAVRGLIVWRGPGNNFLQLVRTGFEKVLIKNNIPFDIKNGKKIIDFISKAGIPEETIHFIGEIAYHQRDKELLELIKEILIDNRNCLRSQKFYFRFLHTLATWNEAVEKNSEESLRLNLEVVKNIKESDPVFYFKAKTGMTYSKDLLPKQKVVDFLHNASELLLLGDGYDAFKVKVEASRAMLGLAKQQGVEEIAFKSLEDSKQIALDSLRIAKDIGYPNLEIVASESLEAIYKERISKLDAMKNLIIKGVRNRVDLKKRFAEMSKVFKNDKRKAESFGKNVHELREKYQYNTTFNKRYKESYFKHAHEDLT